MCDHQVPIRTTALKHEGTVPLTCVVGAQAPKFPKKLKIQAHTAGKPTYCGKTEVMRYCGSCMKLYLNIFRELKIK